MTDRRPVTEALGGWAPVKADVTTGEDDSERTCKEPKTWTLVVNLGSAIGCVYSRPRQFRVRCLCGLTEVAIDKSWYLAVRINVPFSYIPSRRLDRCDVLPPAGLCVHGSILRRRKPVRDTTPNNRDTLSRLLSAVDQFEGCRLPSALLCDFMLRSSSQAADEATARKG